jgi:hypothetical protein
MNSPEFHPVDSAELETAHEAVLLDYLPEEIAQIYELASEFSMLHMSLISGGRVNSSNRHAQPKRVIANGFLQGDNTNYKFKIEIKPFEVGYSANFSGEDRDSRKTHVFAFKDEHGHFVDAPNPDNQLSVRELYEISHSARSRLEEEIQKLLEREVGLDFPQEL